MSHGFPQYDSCLISRVFLTAEACPVLASCCFPVMLLFIFGSKSSVGWFDVDTLNHVCWRWRNFIAIRVVSYIRMYVHSYFLSVISCSFTAFLPFVRCVELCVFVLFSFVVDFLLIVWWYDDDTVCCGTVLLLFRFVAKIDVICHSFVVCNSFPHCAHAVLHC